METSAKTICATVCEVGCCSLCVCDHCTHQHVLVHCNRACCFFVGERICIHYNGIMTMSIPPQINATCIERLGRC